MRGYDEYEDLDEYEEEEGEEEEEVDGEDEYEEEETHQPTKEELEYLELRHKLKESIRKKIKKESGSLKSQEKQKKLPYDNYGSFFGPSQPVIAQRVIQESKSLLENQHLAAKAPTSQNVAKSKSPASTSTGSRPHVNNHPAKVVNEIKKKVQKLKDTRDYSFLLSDDAELPAKKEPPPKIVSTPHSEARSVQGGPPKSKQTSNNGGRYAPGGGHKEKKPMSSNSQTQQPKMASHKLGSTSESKMMRVDSKKQIGSNNVNGPGRPKSAPLRSPPPNVEKKTSASAAGGRSAVVAQQQRPPPSKLSNSSNSKQPLERKREIHESSHNGRVMPKQPVSREPVKGKIMPKQSVSREPVRGKIMPKQPVSSSKSQMHRPPAKTSNATSHVDRPKKKPVRRYSDDEDDDGGKAISMIRKMFNYNPGRFNEPDDDSDMEANFDDIMEEEEMSAKIAKKEDEEELRKIEEEERREEMRRRAKKRKLSQH